MNASNCNQHRQARVSLRPVLSPKIMTRFAISAAIIVALAPPAVAQPGPQTTFRDAGGRTTGTASTDSQGTTVFRDASGRTTGTASLPLP